MRRRRLSNNIRKTGLITAVAFTAACTMQLEPISKSRTAADETAQTSAAEPVKVSKSPEKKEPFAPSEKTEKIVQDLSGTHMEQVEKLHAKLNSSAEGGVKVVDMEGKPPRTPEETMEKGGDCTDLAGVVVPMLKEMEIPGGVLVVHFDNAPEDVHHMVPYAEINGEEIIIDLQAPRLRETADGNYTEVLRLNYDEANSIYYVELGDYYRDKGERGKAIEAYEKSLEYYDKYAYVHQNLGILYEKEGKMNYASVHLKKAAELDPKYKAQETRGSYNYEVQEGARAYRERRWSDCITHFRNALTSGEKLSAKEEEIMKKNVEACEHNAEIE